MSRRTLLRNAALVALLGSRWGCRDSAGTSRPAAASAPGRVVIIGAGVSGLACARELKSRGIESVVLEARDRLGGRVWTDRSLGAPVDFGAAWIHGISGNPISTLADEAGLRTAPTDYEDLHAWDHRGDKVDDADLEALMSDLDEVMAAAEGAARRSGSDLSVAEAVKRGLKGERLDRHEKRALAWYLATREVATGADMGTLSTWWLDDGESFSGGDVLFPGGYDEVVKHLARGARVELGHQVSRIEHGPAGVTVHSNFGETRGDACVVTLPLGVLKAGSVAFEPALPEHKLEAIQSLGMGALDKVALKFERVFWPMDRTFLGYASKKPGQFPVFLGYHRYASAPILVATLGASYARKLEKRSDDQILEEAMKVLRKMFGRATPDPVAHVITRWVADPFAGGSYSHLPLGSTGKHYDTLAAPLGRLGFAGEATNRRYPATVHGALLSGVREGERLAAG